MNIFSTRYGLNGEIERRLSQGIAGLYLDANATVQPIPAVVQAVSSAMSTAWANASSAHSLGLAARRVLEEGRDAVTLLTPGVHPEDVIFTSGGTEASNMVFGWPARGQATILTTAVEHAAVSRPANLARERGATLVILPVGGNGLMDPDDLRRELCQARGSVLVSVQWASGETGVVQPIKALGAIIADRGDVVFHSDAAQAVGRLPTNLRAAGVHALTFSGHKLHGPPGIGVLAIADQDLFDPPPLLVGGDQERGMRSGTHAVPLVAGLAAAVQARSAAFDASVAHMAEVRDCFEQALLDQFPKAEINGKAAPRVCNTSSIRIEGVDGMAMVAQLDQVGIYCSQASACASARPEPSRTLLAMGLPSRNAFETVRFSFSVLNTLEEAAFAARAVASIARRLRG